MRGETEIREPLVRMEDPDSSLIPALEGRRLWSRPENFSINPEMQQYESLNYERSINRHFLRVEREHYVSSRMQGRKLHGYTGVTALRWVVSIVLGHLAWCLQCWTAALYKADWLSVKGSTSG